VGQLVATLHGESLKIVSSPDRSRETRCRSANWTRHVANCCDKKSSPVPTRDVTLISRQTWKPTVRFVAAAHIGAVRVGSVPPLRVSFLVRSGELPYVHFASGDGALSAWPADTTPHAPPDAVGEAEARDRHWTLPATTR
jgi:hypothetical protein